MEFIVAIVVLIVIGLWVVSIYNKLVYNRNIVKEGWSGIETQLKRRSNLIPNLVEAVKGYVGHEKGVLENVTEARARTGQASTPGERGKLEGVLGQALANVFAVAEAYPELKANENFMNLHNELSSLEDEIQMARRYYNGTVRDYNIRVESIPTNLVAKLFGFEGHAFFEIASATERSAPTVRLSS